MIINSLLLLDLLIGSILRFVLQVAVLALIVASELRMEQKAVPVVLTLKYEKCSLF